jgi:hypothetical protein
MQVTDEMRLLRNVSTLLLWKLAYGVRYNDDPGCIGAFPVKQIHSWMDWTWNPPRLILDYKLVDSMETRRDCCIFLHFRPHSIVEDQTGASLISAAGVAISVKLTRENVARPSGSTKRFPSIHWLQMTRYMTLRRRMIVRPASRGFLAQGAASTV